MKILGVDPGYGKCGWAVIEKPSAVSYQLSARNPNLVACDCIETSSKDSLENRLKEIYDAIDYLIKKYKPNQLAIESLFWFKNQKTALAVAQARGVIIVCAKNNGLDIFEYTPLQVKQAVVGYGRGDKKQVQKMIGLHLGKCKTPVQDDTADAVAIGLTHLQTVKYTDRSNSRESNLESHANNTCKNNQLIYPELSYKIVGILYETFNRLGGQLQEKYYYNLIKQLLAEQNISFEFQKKINIYNNYRYFIDFVIDEKIVLELKSNSRFYKKDIDQVMNYLRKSDLSLAILARFGLGGVTTKRLLKGK